MAEFRSTIYLDSCATSPPRKGVVEAMAEVQTSAWGNPSSLHPQGVAAAESLERARLQIAGALSASPDDVIFTSGATESVHLALSGLAGEQKPGRIVISAVEHPAVVSAARQLERQGWDLAIWPVDGFGQIRLELLPSLLAPPTRLVSLIWGQSEVGTLQPVHTVGNACAERGIPFHTDATQVLSQGTIDWSSLPATLLTASAHKLGGPRGIGCLLTRPHIRSTLTPMQGGGGQEQGLRAGTQPVALIAGFAEALSQLDRWTPWDGRDRISPSPAEISRHRDTLLQGLLQDPRLKLTGDPHRRLPHHISLLACDQRKEPLSGRALVRELAKRGVALSSGSACASGKDSGSPVLAAMGFEPAQQRSGLRLSLGPWIRQEQLATVCRHVSAALDHLSSDCS